MKVSNMGFHFGLGSNGAGARCGDTGIRQIQKNGDTGAQGYGKY